MEGPLTVPATATRASVVGLRCRTSDRGAASLAGVDALAPRLGERLGVQPRMIGSPQPPREAAWQDDLRESRGCLLEAGGQLDDALAGGRLPVLLAGEGSVALTTLPTVTRHRPDARLLWLDGHGGFNTPETSESGYLSGMALAGACGIWQAGLGGHVPAERVVLTGVRELGAGERELLERSAVTVIGASLETLVYTQNVLDRAPVYVHLDPDVLDAAHFPSELPAPSGLHPEKLYDLFEAVAGECEVVGLELTAFHAPADELERRTAASTVLQLLEPLLETVAPGAHVSH